MTQAMFTPLKAGDLSLPNRILMAPLTRGRAAADATPTELMVDYYRARVEAGLIISEATAISPQGYGWAYAPGIFEAAHVAHWRRVTEAVHAAGGRMVLQLWHMGRVSHPDFQRGQLPVGPSAIAAKGEAHTLGGKKPYVAPHAMSVDEIKATVRDYAIAARRAMDAGFDGVEVHGANGYLLDEFLRSGSNHRTDAYGGSPENRARFLLEAVEATVRAIGAGKVGVRLSPKNPAQDMHDADPAATFGHAASALNAFGLAYLHVMEPIKAGARTPLAPGERITPIIRRAYRSTIIANGGYDAASGHHAITKGHADAIAYGVPFIANPDLVARFRAGVALNQPNATTFYTRGPKGYTDYPVMKAEAA